MTAGTRESATRVRLSGPTGEVVLTQFVDAFPAQTTTLRFTSEAGVAVVITIRDGSGWLTRSAKADPLPVTDPSDQEVFIANPDGNQSVLHVTWLASGMCRPTYTITIEPGVRRIWVEQLTPPGGDSVGGEGEIAPTFSRPVFAAGVQGSLLYPN